MVQALTFPLPELRLRILHFEAPHLCPLQHTPIRAQVALRRAQPQAHQPHQPRLCRLRQPQHQACGGGGYLCCAGVFFFFVDVFIIILMSYLYYFNQIAKIIALLLWGVKK